MVRLGMAGRSLAFDDGVLVSSTSAAQRDAAEPYTHAVRISRFLLVAATAPVRVGLLAAEAGLAVATLAIGFVKQALGEEVRQGTNPINDVFPLGGAIIGADRMAELTEPDRAMARILARGGLADRLTAPGGIVDLLTAPGGLLDQVTAGGNSLERILAPGGLVTRLLAAEGAIERMFAEDGVIERLLAEDGVVDKLTVKDGPLEQLTEAAEILSRLSPAVETLTPTAETLETAVDTLNRIISSLSSVTDRIPRLWPRLNLLPNLQNVIED